MKTEFEVAVPGGALHVACWGDRGPVVLAVHGITANHMQWAEVAERLGGRLRLVAPDLRGRGRSGGVPGPYGMAAHADDMVAVLDHLGVDQAVVVGHSMGGYVAGEMAERHPLRVRSLILIDGGPAIPAAEGLDVDAVIDAVLGPTVARLGRTYATRQEYLQHWKDHPALAAYWTPALEVFAAYDLEGTEPELRSSVAVKAVRDDSIDTLVPDGPSQAVTRVSLPMLALRAERGMFDNPQGLLTDEIIDYVRARSPQLRDEIVADTNHYTIVMSPHGSAIVADRIATETTLTRPAPRTTARPVL